jgi:endonuclease YncB( thermonuclease family)
LNAAHLYRIVSPPSPTRPVVTRGLAATLVLLWALVVTTQAKTVAELRGKVVGVSDGDTITVLAADKQPHRIRLNGIDAPERGQDFNQVAKKHLSDLVFGKNVLVVWTKRDQYGRIIGTVIVDDVDVNLEQIRSGLA